MDELEVDVYFFGEQGFSHYFGILVGKCICIINMSGE